MKERKANELRKLFAMPESTALKRELAERIKEQRAILEKASDLDTLRKAQAQLEAYKEILKLGKKSRRFFLRLGP